MDMAINPGDLVQSFIGGSIVLRRNPLDTLGIVGVIDDHDVCLVLAVICPNSPVREAAMSVMLMPMGRIEFGWVWATHLLPLHDDEDDDLLTSEQSRRRTSPDDLLA